MFGPDWLANLFMFAFLFGLIFTTVSVLLGFTHVGGLDGGHYTGHMVDAGHAGHIGDIGHAGHIGDAGHVGHVGDVGHAGHVGDIGQAGGVEHELPLSGPSIFNMPTIMAFITWFGGVGYLLRSEIGMRGLFAVPLAVLSGVLGGALMFVLLVRILWPMMSKPLDAADYRLPGTPARVVSPIRAGGVGEIVYTKEGVRFTAGARSLDEEAIDRGASVVIVRYEHGLAFVQDVDKLLSEAGELTAPEKQR